MQALFFLGLIVAAAPLAIKHFRNSLAPLLIAAGGFVLLLKAERFIWEWTLLSLPLLAVGLRYWQGPIYRFFPLSALAGIFALLIVTYWPNVRNGIQHHPLNIESLPYGTTEFIKAQGLKGRYAIAPSYAGYIEFSLPDIKIHHDMQFPPFTGLDFQELLVAMLSSEGLKTYVENYSPGMLGIDKKNKYFPTKTAHQLGYVPVFFDKKIVLFVDKKKFEDSAKQFELKAINPFDESKVQRAKANEAINELKQMLTAVNADYIKRTLVGYLLDQARLDEAKIYLVELKRSSPSDLTTLYYQARFEHLSGDCRAAIPNYLQTVRFGDYNPLTHRQLAECYFLTGQLPKAYTHYSLGLNPYLDNSPEPLLYLQYALSAVGAGENEFARRLLTMIDRFEPKSDIQPQIKALLIDLEGD